MSLSKHREHDRTVHTSLILDVRAYRAYHTCMPLEKKTADSKMRPCTQTSQIPCLGPRAGEAVRRRPTGLEACAGMSPIAPPRRARPRAVLTACQHVHTQKQVRPTMMQNKELEEQESELGCSAFARALAPTCPTCATSATMPGR